MNETEQQAGEAQDQQPTQPGSGGQEAGQAQPAGDAPTTAEPTGTGAPQPTSEDDGA